MLLRALFICLCLSQPAQACRTALVLAMDVSNSVDPGEFRLQVDGLAAALRDPEIAEILVRDQVALSVLQWSGVDAQEVSLDWTQMLSPSHVQLFANAVQRLPRAFVMSNTAPAEAMARALGHFDSAPDWGETVAVAPGLLWSRMPLPFVLDHVNIYLLEDGPGWAVIDTGADTAPARAAWEHLLTTGLGGRPLTRVIATHHDPDHCGLAGWLCRRFGIPLQTSLSSYFSFQMMMTAPGASSEEQYRQFMCDNGVPAGLAREVAHLVLHSADDGVLIAADQVMTGITPHIGIWPMTPETDTLGSFLRSLARLSAAIPPDTTVLPGHGLLFTGLHARCRDLAAHHGTRCDRLVEGEGRRTAHDLVPLLFSLAPTDPKDFGMAFSETLAHANRLVAEGRMRRTTGPDGRVRFAPVSPRSSG
jgi:glyoxylase-like metal-dependent hydrolase (beta-lactamase superfamily II)